MQGEKEGKKRRGMIRLCVASDCDMHLPCVVFECLVCFFFPYSFQLLSGDERYLDVLDVS